MEIYLVRHTPTIAPKGLCYGQTNLTLAEPVIPLFENIKNNIAISDFEIYSSPLTRCTQLAQYIANQQAIQIIDNLMEVNFGDWENQLWDNIPFETMQAWMTDFVNVAPPNGESFISMFQRINSFIENELLNKEYPKPIIIVTHAGVIRCFLCYILEIPLQNAFKIPVEFSSVTKINLDNDKNYNAVRYFNRE